MGAFSKLKKKFLIYALIKSLIAGISAGLTAVGAALIPIKLTGANLHFSAYIAIGVGVAAAVFGLVFWALRPKDAGLAKRLDGDFNLEERAQTSLEFSARSGEIVELQRQDAESRLSNLPKRKLRLRGMWLYALAAVISLSVSVTAFALPAKASVVDPKPDDEPFELTEFQETAIRDLIKYLNRSHLETSIKKRSDETLSGLIEGLKATETVGGMKALVYAAIASIQGAVEEVNSYMRIGTALLDSGANALVAVISDGATAYRSVPLTTEDEADGLYSAGVELVLTAAAPRFRELRQEYTATLEDNLEIKLSQTVLAVKEALKKSGVSEKDNLYIILGELCDEEGDFARLNEKAAQEGMTDEEIQAAIDSFFGMNAEGAEDFASGWPNLLAGELFFQSYRLGMQTYAANALCRIFSLPYEAGGNETLTPPSGGHDDDFDDDRHGGWGTGEDNYGDSVKVYNPATGEYVDYGQLMDEYFGIVQELIRSGELSEEQQRAILEYFDILTNGLKTEEQ